MQKQGQDNWSRLNHKNDESPVMTRWLSKSSRTWATQRLSTLDQRAAGLTPTRPPKINHFPLPLPCQAGNIHNVRYRSRNDRWREGQMVILLIPRHGSWAWETPYQTPRLCRPLIQWLWPGRAYSNAASWGCQRIAGSFRPQPDHTPWSPGRTTVQHTHPMICCAVDQDQCHIVVTSR